MLASNPFSLAITMHLLVNSASTAPRRHRGHRPNHDNTLFQLLLALHRRPSRKSVHCINDLALAVVVCRRQVQRLSSLRVCSLFSWLLFLFRPHLFFVDLICIGRRAQLMFSRHVLFRHQASRPVPRSTGLGHRPQEVTDSFLETLPRRFARLPFPPF